MTQNPNQLQQSLAATNRHYHQLYRRFEDATSTGQIAETQLRDERDRIPPLEEEIQKLKENLKQERTAHKVTETKYQTELEQEKEKLAKMTVSNEEMQTAKKEVKKVTEQSVAQATETALSVAQEGSQEQEDEAANKAAKEAVKLAGQQAERAAAVDDAEAPNKSL